MVRHKRVNTRRLLSKSRKEIRSGVRRCVLPLFALVTLLTGVATLSAQEYEEQAMEILKLYEEGQTDTAYWLVEPLKRNARFVPAALYVRAQMTPDDRALGLYREVIALDPGGAYADDAAYQLVRRYVQKRDSLAAIAWLSMLEKHHPQSPFLAMARNAILMQNLWSFGEEDEAEEEPFRASGSVEFTDTGNDARFDATGGAESADTADSSAEEVELQEFSGYALQVGLLPTQAAAERRAEEVRSNGLVPFIFEKDVDGRSAFAVVVGPYKSSVEAANDKVRVAEACECGAFTVVVE